MSTDIISKGEKKLLPRIGITIGDPAGIGPEIVIKALADLGSHIGFEPVLIGSRKILDAVSLRLGKSIAFVDIGKTAATKNAVFVKDPGGLDFEVKHGVETADTGRAAAVCIETAVAMWKAGQIDAIATAPISKHALSLAGYDYPGHTEFLAKLTNTDQFAMSFFADKLRVVLLSTHLSLVDAIKRVKAESLSHLIEFSSKQFEILLSRKVRIAIAGLNPHASEGGMFGSEEADEITPAIAHCRALGIDVSGPYSSDTIFLRAFRGEFDAVIACYHDQATIAVKCLSFGSAVNVTLGLPLIRTSVDHGTAFDIAGKGIADESSMKSAIELAVELVKGSRLRERSRD
ncbi:MAG: 4-hydroxythreonine-4-phosphate dehydrogenase PdxA [Pyrinomonadaceae bacterium]